MHALYGFWMVWLHDHCAVDAAQVATMVWLKGNCDSRLHFERQPGRLRRQTKAWLLEFVGWADVRLGGSAAAFGRGAGAARVR